MFQFELDSKIWSIEAAEVFDDELECIDMDFILTARAIVRDVYILDARCRGLPPQNLNRCDIVLTLPVFR